MFKKPILAISLALGLTLGLPTASQAVLLSGAGITDYPLPGTTVVDKPELAGLIIEDVLTPFSISGGGQNLSGIIQNRVVRSSVDGTLDFYWRIRPDSGSGNITSFRLGGYEGFTLDADWRPDGLGEVEPTVARYFGDGSGNVNFIFDGEDDLGGSAASGYTTSYFFYLDTAALYYDRSGEFDLTCGGEPNCISETYSTFAPSIIPVPAAVWLFGSALIGFVGFARKRKIA